MDTRWYFDFISPFAYLQWPRVRERLGRDAIELRPILFAALLKRHAHKGPAEIPEKRAFTYRHVVWRAQRLGRPLRFPPAHPFNPLAALRLSVHAGNRIEVVDALFEHLWARGLRGDDAESLRPLARSLGLDIDAALADTHAKAQLQANYEQALADQVFGVPSLVAGGQVFWGEDATDMYLDYAADPAAFDTPEMRRVADLPVGVQRAQPA